MVTTYLILLKTCKIKRMGTINGMARAIIKGCLCGSLSLKGSGGLLCMTYR